MSAHLRQKIEHFFIHWIFMSPKKRKQNFGASLIVTVITAVGLLLGTALSAQAGEFCSGEPFYSVVDGAAGYIIPTQITIDTDCTFQNFPTSNPLTATLNFQTNDPSIYLIVFDNVTFTGNMACANIDHKIWFSNGADYGSSNNCQDLFIPVETIAKQAPAATASIGVPFSYTLTLPSLQLSGEPSLNDLHTVTLWDDISRTATGADLTFVGINAYYKSTGTSLTLEKETLPQQPEGVVFDPLLYSKGGPWTPKNLSYKPIPDIAIPAGEQIVVEITVVLDETPENAAGVQFSNVAKWWFGRAIDVNDDGVISPIDEFFEPLPGEWGISEPMTIGEPDLVVTKSSNTTALNLVDSATFTIDVQNIGGGDAWNTTILDRLPDNPGVTGMCPATVPAITAEIIGSDGVTSVYGPLTQGAGGDYTVSYDAVNCELGLSLTDSSSARIGASEHLVITYQSQLDADTDPGADGITLTNVAGVTQWYSGDSSVVGRRGYGGGAESLTDGTPSVVDYQDSETVTTALSGYYFQKTVENLTSGEFPASTAASGDTLRYRLRLFNITAVINGVTINDILDPNSFDLNTFDMVTDLASVGATYNFDPIAGQLQITGNSGPLDLVPPAELVIDFDITLKSKLSNNTAVNNQAALSANSNTLTAESDDPYLNGVAPPGDPADPTTVTILTPGPLGKTNTQTSAVIGDLVTYRIRVPATLSPIPLYDVRILDDLGQSSADLTFVSAGVVSGGSWSLSNSGTGTNLIIEDTSTGIDIPANSQAVIEITAQLQNVSANQSGLLFNNSASYTYNRMNGNTSTLTNGGVGVSANMSVVEPEVTAGKAVRFVAPASKLPGDRATVGDVLEYTVTVLNSGTAGAFDVNVVDTLPASVSLVPGAATAQINNVDVAGFLSDPTLLLSGDTAWGRQNGDETLDIPAGQSLVLSYQVTVESVPGAEINNSVYVDWSSLNGATASERSGVGCPNVTAPDNYCTGPAEVVVATIDNTTISKAVFDDSYAETPVSVTDPIVRVGDTVTYELTLSLQEYTTRNVVVEDVLPDGLQLESFSLSGGADFSYTMVSQPTTGDVATLRWEFGDITNLPSDDGTPIDSLVISYVARVVTVDPPTGVPYDTSVLRDNLARLSYTSGDPSADPARLTASARIEVRQPQMSPISKVALGSGKIGTGTIADPYQVNISTDQMTFQLSTCNEGLAPAYGLTISDLLAAELDENDLTVNPPVVKIAGNTLSVATEYTLTVPPRGGELLVSLLDGAPVNQGECLTVEYTIGFHTDLAVSKSWSNQARLVEYRSLPLSDPGRIYAQTDLSQVWMTNLVSDEQLLKTLLSAPETTIGDEVVYQIRVPAAAVNVALDGVVVTDALPEQLEYVAASAVNSNGVAVPLVDNSVAPGQVDLGVGHIPAGEQVILTLTARVANNDLADAAISFANTASYSYAGMEPTLDTSSTSSPVSIVEPSVVVAKSVTNVTHPDIAPNSGDILRYRVSLTAEGGSGGDQFSDAFDLSLEDILGLGLAYQNGTVSVTGPGNSIDDPLVAGDGITSAQTLNWSLADSTADIDVIEGTEVIVTYDVLVLDNVLAGQELTNSVITRWTSLDGDSAFERTGGGAPVNNDYVFGPVSTSLRIELAVPFVKSVVNMTTGETPGLNAEPGDTLHYTLVLTNESIVPLTNATVVDELAAQFAPGSLRLISVSDPNADSANTDLSGGTNGTGLLDLRNLTLAAAGDVGDTLIIEFEATLAPVIQSGTAVINQARLSGDYQTSVVSNETSTLIHSTPAFDVWKTSRDITGDPDELVAGDTLRYTMAVKNIGNENAVNSKLFDQVPVNTTYVANSTTLNGQSVVDLAAGTSPLLSGLVINSVGDTATGAMRADAATTAGNVATVTFDVTVNNDVVDSAIISNQAFLNAEGTGSGPAPEEPSDDPDTAIVDDPTRDVVGSVPLVDAHKTVQIIDDSGSIGIVDPGDVLRYSITVSNTAAVPATGVKFFDAVPVNTTYVPNTVQLNGVPVGQPDSGNSPLVAGIDVNSSDLGLPTPGASSGILSPGEAAVISFNVEVNSGVAPGTVISNQGAVSTNEVPDEPTDADGLDDNGDQPTQVVVGDIQMLNILKDVSVVGGGEAEPGFELEYVIRVTNIGSLPATHVVVTDDLGPLAGQVSYVADSGTLNGSKTGVSYAGGLLIADYAASYGDLPPAATAVVRFRVQIDPALAIGTTLVNSAVVSWSDPALTEVAEVSLDVGGTPGSAILNGSVWHDASLDQVYDGGEPLLEGWSVELYRGGQQLATVLTDSSGHYRLSGLPANEDPSRPYELRFRAPDAGGSTPSLGHADSPFIDGPQQISGIVAASGASLQGLNLPITPNGVVYDSVLRTPVVGAGLALLNATTGIALPAVCFDDPAQQNQVTTRDGFYKFDLNFSDNSCRPGDSYSIEVTPPLDGYVATPSQIIPPAGEQFEPFTVPTCPGSNDDAVPTTADYCEVTASASLPSLSVPARTSGTLYYLNLSLSDAIMPGQSQIFNNHIPIDPELDGAVSISKTSSSINVKRGELVPYSITATNLFAAPLFDIGIVDRFPAGFKYVEGSARLDGEKIEPVISGRELLWDGLDLQVNEEHKIQLLLIVGAGVSEGEYVNRAQVINMITGGAASGEASATVRVVPDPTFDCTDVIGKVFDDRNLNGRQDLGEQGLAGTRVVTVRGLIATADEYGRFHITCAAVPDEDRGSNFILKLDDRSLPTGYRVITENPRIQRATRGKMLRFNFGATIHRVVSLDISNGVFEPDSTQIRLQWRSKIDRLLEVLHESPSVLRLSYLADVENESLVNKRLKLLKGEIAKRWDQSETLYRLSIESEIFWRHGGPR